jgi:hypothetical protein
MSTFECLSVLPSIIVGVGITHMIMGSSSNQRVNS